MNLIPHLIIGNPENRRVKAYVHALKQADHPEPIVLSHQEIIQNIQSLSTIPNRDFWVRIDSVGENPWLEYTLLSLGYESSEQVYSQISPAVLKKRKYQYGEILCPRQCHIGFQRYLSQLQDVFSDKTNWRILSPISQIDLLFDKRSLLELYENLGVPVPEKLEPPGQPILKPSQLRRHMRDQNCATSVVKLSCGSSASCLAIYQHDQNKNMLTTTIKNHNHGWFNSLKIMTYTDDQQIEDVLCFLLNEGCRIEKYHAKARLENAYMDCRILTVHHQARFTIVRQNNHPITNLHLGGWRGDYQQLRRSADQTMWSQMIQDCTKISKAHNCFHLGIDVMFEPDFKHYRFLESNAFGDLLPNLDFMGHSVYQWQIKQLEQLDYSPR